MNNEEKEFLKMLKEVSSVGIRPCISKKRIENWKILFENKQYSRIVAKVMGYVNLRTKASVVFVEDSKVIQELREFPGCEDAIKVFIDNPILSSFDRIREPGCIGISIFLPMIGTKEFERHIFPIKFGESLKYSSFETFLYIVAHEISHALLWGLRHPQKESELATDSCVIALGFGEIMKKGRVKGELRYGYLSDKQFKMAYSKLKYKRSLNEVVKDFLKG